MNATRRGSECDGIESDEMATECDEGAAVKVRGSTTRSTRRRDFKQFIPIARHSFSTIFSLANNHAIPSFQFT